MTGNNDLNAKRRIYLSPPHLTGGEEQNLSDALASNWVAPLGPHVTAFEQEFAEVVGARFACSLSSGTAAIHLGLITSGVQAGDEVLVSTLTFSASVNPIRYIGATPVFVDSERASWNMDPELVRRAVVKRARLGRLPKAILVVHLYGQTADLAPICEICTEYGIPLIEDAAESLGATYQGTPPGTFGRAGAFSFNGNKMITTSGGGMLVSDDEALIEEARHLATQARDSAPHYQHSRIGFNYRLSNLLAGVGRAQLAALPQRVSARRAIYEQYVEGLSDLPGLTFMPEAPWGTHCRWLTTLLIEPDTFGVKPLQIIEALSAENIEARPVWKPMHLQPVFAEFESVGGEVASDIFRKGLCLPSGSALTSDDVSRVIQVLRAIRHL